MGSASQWATISANTVSHLRSPLCWARACTFGIRCGMAEMKKWLAYFAKVLYHHLPARASGGRAEWYRPIRQAISPVCITHASGPARDSASHTSPTRQRGGSRCTSLACAAGFYWPVRNTGYAADLAMEQMAPMAAWMSSGVFFHPGESRTVPWGKVPRWPWAAGAH